MVREVVARNRDADAFLEDIAQAFQLPEPALRELTTRLEAATASRGLGLSEYLEHLLAELHSNTWFTVDQSTCLTETRLGTGPGSCFADVLFNVLFAKILGEVRDVLSDAGVLTELQWSGQGGLPQDESAELRATTLLAETVWADDLALFIHHEEPAILITNLQIACRAVFNACLGYGLQPNFAKGKTEVLVALRGKGATALRRHWFTEQACVLPIPDCYFPNCEVKLVARYRHLGGYVDTKGTAKGEVTARIGQMKATHKKYKKSLFTPGTVSLEKRSALLRPLC